jgi:hypothetical protein
MLGDALFLHIRVLLEFFQRGSRYIFNGVELDTILASDYGFQTSNVHGGRSIWERLNKEYAHLSYGRTDAPWDMQLLVPLLDRCRKFAETVISGANQPLVAGDEKQLKRWLQVHAECAAITIEPPSP